MRNLGTVDRAIRVVAGLLFLLWVPFGMWTFWSIAGLVLIVTGIVGFCPLYRLFGISTCRRPAAT